MLKNLLIDIAYWLSERCVHRSERWLARSYWWSDFAESTETGIPMDEIRKDREDEA